MRLLLLAALAFVTPVVAAPPADAPLDHVLVVESLTTDKGQTLSVSIEAKSPWKWNAEYPAKLEFELPAGVKADKTSLKMVDGDFKEDTSKVRASTALTTKAPGEYVAVVKGRFGLCNAKLCITKKVDTTAKMKLK
jgi:hypothetical protein